MIKEKIGFYIEPGGLNHKMPYYGIRYNQEKAHMSQKQLGLQILIESFSSLVWINIEESWLCR